MKSIWKAIVSWFTRKEEPAIDWDDFSRVLAEVDIEVAISEKMAQRDKAKRQKKKWTPIQREIELLQAQLMKLEG